MVLLVLKLQKPFTVFLKLYQTKPPIKISWTIDKFIETSYGIICAAERKLSKMAYFELVKHPP